MVISDRRFRAMYGDISAEDIFGVVKQGVGLATGIVGAVRQGSAGGVAPSVTPAYPSATPAWGVPPAYQQPQPDHTMLYVLGGVAALGVIGFLLLKK